MFLFGVFVVDGANPAVSHSHIVNPEVCCTLTIARYSYIWHHTTGFKWETHVCNIIYMMNICIYLYYICVYMTLVYVGVLWPWWKDRWNSLPGMDVFCGCMWQLSVPEKNTSLKQTTDGLKSFMIQIFAERYIAIYLKHLKLLSYKLLFTYHHLFVQKPLVLGHVIVMLLFLRLGCLMHLGPPLGCVR